MSLLKQPLLTESVVNLMIDQINSQFNTLLADVDNQYTDGISLEPLDKASIYISTQFQTLNPPAVFILFKEHAFQYTKDPNYLDSKDKCIVAVSAQDVGADNLTKKSWRYGRVIFDCFNLVDLQTTETPPRLKITTVPQRLGYTQPIRDTLNASAQEYRMDCVLELEIKHFERNLVN
jgi:hypothetical protein